MIEQENSLLPPRTAMEVKSELSRKIFRDETMSQIFTGVGVSSLEKDGQKVLCVKLYLAIRLNAQQQSLLPLEIDGVPVAYEFVGKILAAEAYEKLSEAEKLLGSSLLTLLGVNP